MSGPGLVALHIQGVGPGKVFGISRTKLTLGGGARSWSLKSAQDVNAT